MNTKKQIVLIGDNIRSVHNVGSMFRTADAFAVEKIIFTGVSPTPKRKDDTRLPHVILKSEKVISKVALGAEKSVKFEYCTTTNEAINKCRNADFEIIAIEQSPESRQLKASEFDKLEKIAIIIGTETTGLKIDSLKLCDKILEMKMLGAKESINASVMTGIALFTARLAK